MRSSRTAEASERGHDPLDGLDRHRADLDFLGRIRGDQLVGIDANQATRRATLKSSSVPNSIKAAPVGSGTAAGRGPDS